MCQPWRRRLNRALVLLAMLCALQAPAWAVGGPSPPTASSSDAAAQPFAFDIPAQPLAEALRRYASLTRQPTLFRSDLVDGKSSTAVLGRYSSEAALHRLLDGTGITAEKSEDAGRVVFVLKEVDPTLAAPRASLGTLAGYPSAIQARVWNALCADARTAPGAYRSLLRFEINDTGRIEGPRLLGSTGDATRDAAIVAILQRVRMDGPPPPDLPQPVTMLIVPHEEGSADEPRCDEEASAS